MAHDYAKKPRSNSTSGARSQPRKAAPRRAPSRQAAPVRAGVPGWLWLVVGTAVGAFIMFLVRLAEIEPTKTSKPPVAAEKAKAPAKPAPVVKTASSVKPPKSTTKPEPEAKRVEPAAPTPNVIAAEPQTAAAPAAAEPDPSAGAPEKPRFDFYQMLKENDVPVAGEATGTAGASASVAPAEERNFILQVASYRKPEDAEQLKVELILLNLTDARTEAVTVRNGEKWTRVLVGPFKDRSALSKARSTLLSNGHQALVLEYKPSN